MGGTGHLAKMVRDNRLKTAQRKERISNYKKNSNGFSNSNTKLEFQKVSKKKIDEIRLRNLIRLKKEKRKNVLLLIISILITIPLFIYIVFTFANQIPL